MSNWDYRWWGAINEDWVSPYKDSSDAVRFTYWWEDMRPHEVRKLIEEAYEAGYDRGLTDSMDNFEKEREGSVRDRLDNLKLEIYNLEMELVSGNG